MSINSFSGTSFTGSYGFGVICDVNITYYSLDMVEKYIIKYDENWQYLDNKAIDEPINVITVDKELFVAARDAIMRLDRNMNQLYSHGNSNSNYGGSYYNKTIDSFLVTSEAYTRLDVFSRTLSLTESISIAPYYGLSCVEYNNKLFIGTSVGTILIMQQKIVISSFTTVCSAKIYSILIDDYDCLAILCSNNIVYLYRTNGTYRGVSRTVTTNSKYMGFDANGKLIISASSGLYFYY
jgi:hypothetical protein